MDFETILYKAQKNEKTASKEIRPKCYSTKFEPPKKEIKSKTNLSANIQKYLQKREEEEKKKADEEKKKKEELLALRSQDRKAYKRVQTMLKRTKSANKSVMEDAIDDVNTVVTMAGPQQCDEDDYGYVSQEASAFYAKLMDKYSNMPPEEPKFPEAKKPVAKDLNAAKDRVRAALQKEEEEEMMPHKRKRRSKADKSSEEGGDGKEEGGNKRFRDSSPVEEPKPKKPRSMAPPPMDFSSLLKLAEQKQFEPIKVEKKVEEDDGRRPMTKKERLEYERERERRERRMEQERVSKNGQRRPDSLNKIPRLSESNERKEKPNGLGRIPKKSNTMDNKSKSEILRKELSRKDSPNSEHQSKSNNQTSNYRPSPKTGIDSKGNNYSEKESIRNRHLTENRNRPDNERKTDSSHRNYDRKPSQTSIALNKVRSRKHNISDDDQSQVSGSENEKSVLSDQEKYMSDSSKSSSKYSMMKRNNHKGLPSESSKNPAPNLSRNGSKYNQSYSDSGSEDESKYRPTAVKKPNHSNNLNSRYSNQACSGDDSDNENVYKPSKKLSSSNNSSNHDNKYSRLNGESDTEDENKYRPTKISNLNHSSKYSSSSNSSKHYNKYSQLNDESEPENENKYRPSKKLDGKNSSKYSDLHSESGTDDENKYKPKKLNSPLNNSNYGSKYSQIHSDSGTEDENKYKPTRKPNFSNENPGQTSKLKRPHSDSRTDDETEYKPSKKPCASVTKGSKVRSLFESSDNDKFLNHDSDKSQRQSDSRKYKPTHDLERHKTVVESKFKIPKSGSKSDLDKRKELEHSEKRRIADKDRTPTNSNLKSDVTKERNKMCDSRSDKFKTDSSNKHQSASERPKERSVPSKEVVKKEISDENVKKPTQLNAEEALKKSAKVWSKPCNLTPSSNPTPTKTPSGLSESQIQRLREMNKKPAQSKPTEKLTQSSFDRRPLQGRPNGPLPGKPNLLRAAAEAAAARSSQNSVNTTSKDREPEKQRSSNTLEKKQTLSSSRSRENEDSKQKQTPSKEVGPKSYPTSDVKPRQFPPSDIRPRQFPPKDVRPRQFPPPDVRRKPQARRIIEDDSEEEYDSEMDDFIDDGSDMHDEEISREIQNIFGYDRSRYDNTDDDECMVSNFGQIDREELISLREGAKEDLADIMYEKKRKQMLKQKKLEMLSQRRKEMKSRR